MITVSHIQKSYGRNRILRDISFSAEPGDCIGILGVNGCGKSTLLGILAGAVKADEGEILYGEESALGHRDVFVKMTGYVPQTNPLMEDLSALDNLKLWYSNSPYDMYEDLEKGALSMLGISAFLKKRVSRLSGGMQKRLSIGCALSGRPPVLVLDEPGAALDLVCKEDIRSFLKTYLEKQGIVILTTHEESDLQTCTKLFLLQEGVLNQLPAGTSAGTIMKRMQEAAQNGGCYE